MPYCANSGSAPCRAFFAAVIPLAEVMRNELDHLARGQFWRPRARTAATLWAARWLGWGEDGLLTCPLLT
jgi:hypothetical protein